MAEYEPPTENLPIFDSSVFNNPASTAGITAAQAAALYLKRTGIATSTATNTDFGGVVQFDSALVIYNGKQNTSLGNGFLPLASGQGDQNVVIGVGAGANGVMGQGNTVVGYFSASDTKTAGCSQNALFGSRAGQHLTSGAGNTLIGNTTGNNITTGITNICLGNGAMAGESSGSLSNNIVIGNNVQSGASNRIIIGDGTQTTMDLQVLPTALGGGVIRMNNNLSMNNTTAIANRQISSTYYNFYASNNVSTLTYSGRLYGNLNSIVYDCPDTSLTGSSNHIFYNYNGASVLNSLTISNTGITNNTVQPLAGNSSNIVPTTAWVQSAIALAVPSTPTTTTILVQVGGYNAATGLAFPSPVNVTVPANAQYADVFLAGVGGYAGQGGDRSAGGYYTGGAGGGACAASGRIYCKGLTMSISKSLGVVTLTVGGIGIIDVASGSGGGGASPSAGGPGGIATTTAPNIYQPGYSSWFTYTGTAGGAGQANNPPTVGAIKYTGYNASALLGCGQMIATSGGANPYALQTSYFGGAIITFYST